MIIMRFLRWLLRLITGGRRPRERQHHAITPKTICTLLIYPRVTDALILNETTLIDTEKYFLTAPWIVDTERINQAVRFAENWLAETLGDRISWQPVMAVDSHLTVAEWRAGNIYLIKDEVDLLGLPWSEEYIYLAFVRGMGGYAGGIGYQDGNAGYGMVGDVCLEALCEYQEPTSGSVLLGEAGQQTPTRSLGRPERLSMRHCMASAFTTPKVRRRRINPSGTRR